MKKVIVTGANGFIGAALCKELADQGTNVIAVVRDKNSTLNNIKNLPGIKIVYCDFSNFRNLADIIHEKNIEVMYHLAWIGTAGTLRGNDEVQLNNIKYTCDTIKACKELNCPKFVFASSIMEFEIEKLMRSEQKPNINTLYSSAKLAADYMGRTIAATLGVSYIRAVISNVYGIGENSPRLVNSSIRKMLHGEHCSFSAGEQIYDFIYITDAAKAFIALGDKGKPNKTYYLGSCQPKPLKEFLIEMRNAIDSKIEIGLGEVPFNGVSLSYKEFDVNALYKDTGFKPELSFSDGVKKTAIWIKENIL